jgi:putative hemolysin
MDVYIIILQLAGLGLLLSLSAFFSGSETALFSLSKIQTERLRQENGKRGAVVAGLLDNPRRLLITILVGNMFVNVASASLVASFTTALLGNKGVGIAVGITTVLLLIFGEITPKTVAVHNAEPISKLVAYPIKFFSKLIFPLRVVLRSVTNTLMRLVAGGSIPVEDRFTTEEFRAMVEVAEEEGSIKEHEKEMLHTIFELRSISAAEIMVPRTEMVCASEESNFQQIFDLARTVGRSRIPVYRDDTDHITGIVYIRDFPTWRHFDIYNMTVKQFLQERGKLLPRRKDTLVRQPIFVPETRAAVDLFQDFRNKGAQMAILLDEYGGTAGLVTMEDLVEELVGEITDEYDATSESFRRLDDSSTLVAGGTSIRNVNRKLELQLTAEEEMDTIGGYVTHLFGRIPNRGEVFSAEGLEFEIAEADRQRITYVIIRRISGIGDGDDLID